MSAADDYPLVNNLGKYQWQQMCDEIDRLRALNLQQLRINSDLREQVERDGPVIDAAEDAPDEVNETQPGPGLYISHPFQSEGEDCVVCRNPADHVVHLPPRPAPDEVNEAET